MQNVNVVLSEKNVIQINSGITVNVYVGAKNVMCVKKIIFRLYLDLLEILIFLKKMRNYKLFKVYSKPSWRFKKTGFTLLILIDR